MITFIVIAIIMIFLARKTYPNLVKFDKPSFVEFLKLMLIVTVVRIIHFKIDGAPEMGALSEMNPISLFWVFWEDMFFVFPSILIYTITKNKWLVAPIMVISSLSFAIGHIYQSWTWALILLAYVPLMFYLGRKHGLGTVMAAHVFYDVVTYLTVFLWIWFGL